MNAPATEPVKGARELSKRRVRTPIILQMEAVECGAASLGIVLGYFGRFVSLDKLRVECGVSRDGSNAANIVRVAKAYGCATRGYRQSADEVLKGGFPVILFWNFNHFLVLEGASGSHVYLNDPAVGHRSVPISEFKKSFSGIVISIVPGSEFEKGGKPPRPIIRLLRLAMDYRVQLAFVLLIGILLAIPGFVIPNFAGVFVDHVLLGKQEDWLRPLAAALAVAIILLGLLAWLKNAVLLRVETHMAANRSAEFMWHVLRLPARFFTLRYLGDIASRVTNVQDIAQVISTQIGAAAINMFTASVLFLLMFFLDHILALIAIGGALINVIVLRLLQNIRFETSMRLNVEQGKLFATSVIGIRTMETLKANGREDDFFNNWAGHHARAINSEQLLSRLDQLSALVPALIAMATMAVALWVGGTRVIDTALTLGGFIAFQALFSALAAPVQQVVDSAGQTQQTAADLTRIDDVLDHPLDWRHDDEAKEDIQPTKAASLALKNITFGYNPQAAPLIDGFNLKIKKGGWVALVGESGSGKTTVGKLACGLYQPWSGDVHIDGRDIKSIERRSLARLIGSVDQDIVLLDGSIRDNITLWDDTIPEEDMVAAARDAQLLEAISTRPGGFEAPVGEHGRNFSGGEGQRIEIARTLARAPALLVLDEATSALDPETENKVVTALRKRGLSCLVVAHRLSTIRDCDEIIVLEHGQVVERGTHDELVAAKGKYLRLIKEEKG